MQHLKYFGNLTEQENGQYLVNALLNTIKKGVSNGEFEPGYPLTDIFMYITASIDEVIKSAVFQKCYGVNPGNIDVVNIMKIISDSVLHLFITDIKAVKVVCHPVILNAVKDLLQGIH